MLTIEKVKIALGLQVKDTGKFLYKCFGSQVKYYDFPNDVYIIACGKTKQVFLIGAWPTNQEDDELIWIDPQYVDAYQAEESKNSAATPRQLMVTDLEDMLAMAKVVANQGVGKGLHYGLDNYVVWRTLGQSVAEAKHFLIA